uniref:T9SS type A sorting domain-containing protein n=1 Tax=candidate division WOR-3 bacterium TaxID=2052148 RepID=A0A7C4X8Z6_UNCW3
MIFLILISTGWPLAPQDSTHPLGNNWGEFQDYGGYPYMHPGIDVMGMTVGRPVYAVQSGIVKAWLTTSGEWHWRLAIADYNTNDSVEGWLYAHIDPNQYHKNIGEFVNEGDLIGYLVEWPVSGFDHCHFARIKDAGAVWQYADWAFVQNPLVLISPYDDTVKPVFENAYGNYKFAICQNNTSIYLNPDNVNGDVDIIAKIYDRTGVSLPQYPIWERMIPLRISYEIHGPQNVSEKLSFLFKGYLNYANNVDVVYKDDAICDSRGDYEFRDYYFIVTNTDGDSLIEASDASFAWDATNFAPGHYWIIITASDPAGNTTKDSMMVTIPGPFVEERSVYSIFRSTFVNPTKVVNNLFNKPNAQLYDINGRIVSEIKDLSTGIYFVLYKENNQFGIEKIVVVK